VPITEYCDEKRLTTTDRLKRFIDVCHAVQHAHQKGIIHRDIKPTNVMVTLIDTKPVPKVIDLGIAKATQQRLTEKTLYTSYHPFIGTPQYMSPEQAAMCDQDVDTRSDIYSLGVLLYELLIGTTPFDPEELRKSSYDQVCRTIRETDPQTPSKRLSTLGDAITTVSEQRRVQPGTLKKQLAGDLDWIVIKALEKDRARRYETVDALAQDIQRHLADEPVRARPPSAIYRLKKFMRKYRGRVTAAAVVLAALVLGLVLAVTGLLRARHEQHLRMRQLYISDVNSAHHAWQHGNVDRAAGLLRRHAPRPGDEDLRGFEWYYLWGLCQRSQQVPTLDQAPVTAVAMSPDGRLLAAASPERVRLWDTTALSEIAVLNRMESAWCLALTPIDVGIVAVGGPDCVTLCNA